MSQNNWISNIAGQRRFPTFILMAIVVLVLAACAAKQDVEQTRDLCGTMRERRDADHAQTRQPFPAQPYAGEIDLGRGDDRADPVGRPEQLVDEPGRRPVDEGEVEEGGAVGGVREHRELLG